MTIPAPLQQRLKSKTYWFNLALVATAFLVDNAAVLGITPQTAAMVALAGIVLRETTTKPLREK